MNTTLVVMAAGMGSRFGGLKQMEPITQDGRVILDFSVYDALQAGFDKVVFIIKKDMEQAFRQLVGNRIAQKAAVEYVFQTTDDLPPERTKPWGTGHAILCCQGKVTSPFAVINADDYYGRHAFRSIQKELTNACGLHFSMVAYDLAQTLSANGSVARGVCRIENGMLVDVTERTKIQDFTYIDSDGTVHELPQDTKVSMNLWGLTPDFFPVLEQAFARFKNTANLAKDEFFLPHVIDEKLKDGSANVKVFMNGDKWYGVTYREDLGEVVAALNGYIKEGYYDGI